MGRLWRAVTNWRRRESPGIDADNVGKRARAPIDDERGTYADDPLSDLGDDLLGRRRLAQRVTSVLGAIVRQTESAVVALVGPWGSGKTTLLLAVEQEANSSGSWYVAKYNPWSYSSFDSAVAGFFSELRSALPKDALQESRRAALGRLGARMAPVGALGGIVGVDASEGLRELARLVGGDRSPEDLRDEAAKQLRSLDRPALVLIDDLDRLEPSELLLTFKLVRLLGRLPNVYYVLSYDEATLESVLSRTQLVGPEPGRARDYLEKMVQVRIDVPPLLPEQRALLVNESLKSFLVTHDLELSSDQTVRLQQIWSKCLDEYLQQPRAVKKLFAQLDALWPEVSSEVDLVDFLAMTFLRTFERSVYELVLDRKAELTGGFYRGLGSEKESNAARWERWQADLAAAGARKPVALGLLLAELFLPIKGARENMSYGHEWGELISARQGVGSAEFFDRYSQLGVPAGDFSDALLARAVEDFRMGVSSDATEALEAKMSSDANLVVRKLSRLADGDALPPGPVVELLSRRYAEAREQKTGVLGMSPDFMFLSLATRLLDRMASDEAASKLQQVASSDSGLELAVDVLRKVDFADEADEDRAWPEKSIDAIVALSEDRLKSATRRKLSLSDRWLLGLLFGLKQFRGQDYVQAFVWNQLLAEPSAWVLDDLLGLMVPIGTASDGRSSWESMGDFDPGVVDSLLGLDRVVSALGTRLEGGDLDRESDVDRLERRRAEISFESLRRHALSAVGRAARAQARARTGDGGGG